MRRLISCNLRANATSASLNFPTKTDNSGYVKAGIVVSNANGSFTAGAKIYDAKSKNGGITFIPLDNHSNGLV